MAKNGAGVASPSEGDCIDKNTRFGKCLLH